MNSARKTCRLNEIEEKIQDNRLLTRQIGERNEMDVPKSLITEIYPWILRFKKMCRSSLSQRSISSLKSLMTFYVRNVRPSVNECRTKPLRAEKLKDCIGETMLFFLYYYRDVGETKDRDDYMIVMSDLLAMYIDTELKASKEGKEHCSKISARLSSRLHVYLEDSAEYLLDTLLKVHFMTQNYHEILDPVITKIFETIDDHPNSTIMYVRYLLAYRLWKKLNNDVAVRNRINVIGLSSLGEAPIDFPSCIIESVLPRVSKTQKLSTKMLLVQKFDVDKACQEFLNFCNNERAPRSPRNENASLTSTIPSLPEDNNDCRELIINKNNHSIVSNETIASPVAVDDIDLEISKRPSVTESTRSSNLSSLRRLKKSNDIAYIDLTSDGTTEKVVRKTSTRRKLFWLEEAKKRISSKIIVKKDSTIEDEQPFEDLAELDGSGVTVPTSRTSSNMDIEVKGTTIEDKNEKIINEDSSERVITIDKSDETLSNVTSEVVNKSQRFVEPSEFESKDERTLDKREAEPKVTESVPKVSTIRTEASTLETDNFGGSDRCPGDDKIYDSREPALRDDVANVETSDRLEVSVDSEESKIVVARNVQPPAVKPIVRSNEIINEAVASSGPEVYQPFPISSMNVAKENRKIGRVEFQENIDGLSLLASVSQRISKLTTSIDNQINPVEVIKVKNYAVPAGNVRETSSDACPFSSDTSVNVVDKIVDIYPKDATDEVAYRIGDTSNGETEANFYENRDRANNLDSLTFSHNDETRCNGQSRETNVVAIEQNLAEKDDANVILNGETVVLYQKLPNSNLYIINKAVENRDHADEVSNPRRDVTEDANDPRAFSYEIYDNICRNKTTYEISRYNRELTSQRENRRSKKVMADNEQRLGTNRGCDSSLETTKAGKKSTNLSRRRIKREYEGCAGDISNRHDSNYGIQDCSQEHDVEATRSIHIPVVSRAAPLSSMYTKFPSGTELYVPCHETCNSIACALPVNSSTTLHTGKNSTGNSPCSCLNCTYGIMTHCGECIIPNDEAIGAAIDPSSYYLPLRTAQNLNLRDYNGSRVDEKLSGIYDDQLVCKIEETILNGKVPLENVGFRANEIYRAELDNKLPLKKRFKAIMSMSLDDVPIKRENIQSYPGTPMLSIAALEATNEMSDHTGCNENSLEATPKRVSRNEMHEMIRRDYNKDATMLPPSVTPLQNGFNAKSGKKMKRPTSENPCETTNEASFKKIRKTTSSKHGETVLTSGISCKRTITTAKTRARPSEKVIKEPGLIVTKNSTRQTRSSKRNVPKVNYIYADGDSDWNPSVGDNVIGKRKRKRTGR